MEITHLYTYKHAYTQSGAYKATFREAELLHSQLKNSLKILYSGYNCMEKTIFFYA